MTPDNNELEKWHRFFAIENNNLAWELATRLSRTPEESMNMLNAAHASALHWGQIGTELHVIRATMLLAEVHALENFGESSLAMSEKVSNYFQKNKADDWEIALVCTIHAHSAAVAGRQEVHLEHYRAAEHAIAAIADDEDRKIVLQTFNQVPAPPLIL